MTHAALTFGPETQLTEGASADSCPNPNADSRSVVFKRREGERSRTGSMPSTAKPFS